MQERGIIQKLFRLTEAGIFPLREAGHSQRELAVHWLSVDSKAGKEVGACRHWRCGHAR